MRIFVAGATGALGRRLVPLLVAGGHAVTGMTHSPAKVAGLRAAGARPVLADALDRDDVLRAVVAAQPNTAGVAARSARNDQRSEVIAAGSLAPRS